VRRYSPSPLAAIILTIASLCVAALAVQAEMSARRVHPEPQPVSADSRQAATSESRIQAWQAPLVGRFPVGLQVMGQSSILAVPPNRWQPDVYSFAVGSMFRCIGILGLIWGMGLMIHGVSKLRKDAHASLRYSVVGGLVLVGGCLLAGFVNLVGFIPD